MKRNLIKKQELTGWHDGLYGDCSGLRGDCTGLSGDLDKCDITADDRKNGINIKDLIREVLK